MKIIINHSSMVPICKGDGKRVEDQCIDGEKGV